MKSNFYNPNWLREMPRKKLKAYIFNLVRLVENEINEHNLSLYKRWLEEAQNELCRRDNIITYFGNKYKKTTK